MAILIIPDKRQTLSDFKEIQTYLAARGVLIRQWQAEVPLAENASEREILDAYREQLKPYMAENGYQTADVITVNSQTQNLEQIREKFLREHTHSEDEVRFFVDGQGYFWFNFENGEPVVCVKCEAGDLLSVPAGYKHWFDLGEPAFVKAIRIFIDAAGWVPHYTESGVESYYQGA